jgi:hypothetical protein
MEELMGVDKKVIANLGEYWNSKSQCRQTQAKVVNGTKMFTFNN